MTPWSSKEEALGALSLQACSIHFLWLRFNRFKRYYAVSAGTMALTSFLQGSASTSSMWLATWWRTAILFDLATPLNEEGLMNLAHLFDHVRRHRPLDIKAAASAAKAKEVRMVTTDFETGRPLYLKPKVDDWLRIMWASSTLPMVTRGKIKVRNQWMFDGGISDALPLQAAIDGGGKNILVIRTRPSGEHIAKGWMDTFATYWYRENPAIVDLYNHGHTYYNDDVDRLVSGGEGRVSWEEIAPLKPLRSDGYRINAGQLIQDYHHGMERALDWLEPRI